MASYNPYMKINPAKFDSSAGSAMMQQSIQSLQNAFNVAGQTVEKVDTIQKKEAQDKMLAAGLVGAENEDFDFAAFQSANPTMSSEGLLKVKNQYNTAVNNRRTGILFDQKQDEVQRVKDVAQAQTDALSNATFSTSDARDLGGDDGAYGKLNTGYAAANKRRTELQAKFNVAPPGVGVGEGEYKRALNAASGKVNEVLKAEGLLDTVNEYDAKVEQLNKVTQGIFDAGVSSGDTGYGARVAGELRNVPGVRMADINAATQTADFMAKEDPNAHKQFQAEKKIIQEKVKQGLDILAKSSKLNKGTYKKDSTTMNYAKMNDAASVSSAIDFKDPSYKENTDGYNFGDSSAQMRAKVEKAITGLVAYNAKHPNAPIPFGNIAYAVNHPGFVATTGTNGEIIPFNRALVSPEELVNLAIKVQEAGGVPKTYSKRNSYAYSSDYVENANKIISDGKALEDKLNASYSNRLPTIGKKLKNAGIKESFYSPSKPISTTAEAASTGASEGTTTTDSAASATDTTVPEKPTIESNVTPTYTEKDLPALDAKILDMTNGLTTKARLELREISNGLKVKRGHAATIAQQKLDKDKVQQGWFKKSNDVVFTADEIPVSNVASEKLQTADKTMFTTKDGKPSIMSDMVSNYKSSLDEIPIGTKATQFFAKYILGDDTHTVRGDKYAARLGNSVNKLGKELGTANKKETLDIMYRTARTDEEKDMVRELIYINKYNNEADYRKSEQIGNFTNVVTSTALAAVPVAKVVGTGVKLASKVIPNKIGGKVVEKIGSKIAGISKTGATTGQNPGSVIKASKSGKTASAPKVTTKTYGNTAEQASEIKAARAKIVDINKRLKDGVGPDIAASIKSEKARLAKSIKAIKDNKKIIGSKTTKSNVPFKADEGTLQLLRRGTDAEKRAVVREMGAKNAAEARRAIFTKLRKVSKANSAARAQLRKKLVTIGVVNAASAKVSGMSDDVAPIKNRVNITKNNVDDVETYIMSAPNVGEAIQEVFNDKNTTQVQKVELARAKRLPTKAEQDEKLRDISQTWIDNNLNKRPPLSVKNNNPGNIKLNKANDWKGQTNTGSKTSKFVNFSTPEEGIRATKKVIEANLAETNNAQEFILRYATEPEERAIFDKTGKLPRHLENYAKDIAKSQGLNSTKDPMDKVDMNKFIKTLIKREGGADALKYFTDDIIEAGMNA